MFKIGDLTFNNPVILAPLSGVTDQPFREIVKSFGADLVVSEMIASRAMIIQTKQSLQKQQGAANDTKSAVQLAGCDPEVMAEAARLVEDMGAKIIDINFGCPAKKVVGGYAGSYLMKDEDLAARIVESTVNAVSIPVTVKMRTGWDYENRNAPSLAKKCENSGAQMITVHGRTRCQFYQGHSDWEFISRVKSTINIPVIANGDIRTFLDAQEALKLSKADGIMIGRGIYGKPWLITQLIAHLQQQPVPEAPSKEKLAKIILNHYKMTLELYGRENGSKIIRKHLGWYSSGMYNSSEFRSTINTTTDIELISDKIHEFFGE
jgi:tRNA-dihydrouridine synthase B